MMTFEGAYGSSDAQTARYPTIRLFIGDLIDGVWEESEKTFTTRYNKVKRVRLVGIIIEKREVLDNTSTDNFLNTERSNSRVSFKIEDGTGQLWATYWGGLPQDFVEFKPGLTVLIIGSVRSYRGKPSINIDIIKKLINPNSETQHILQIVHRRRFEPRHQFEKSILGKQEFKLDEFDTPKGNVAPKSEPDNILEDLEFFESNSQSKSKSKTPVELKKKSEENLPTNINNSDNIKDTNIELKNDTATILPNKQIKLSDSSLTDQLKTTQTEMPNDVKTDNFSKSDLIEKIYCFIKENDPGDGVAKKVIGQNLRVINEKLQSILDQLVQDVRIYKVKPGFYSTY